MGRSTKKRRRGQRNVVRSGLVLLMAVSVMCMIARAVGSRKSDREVEVVQSQEENVTEESKELTQEEKIQLAKENAIAAGAPDGIIAILEKNPETLDFVANYAALKDNPPAETAVDSVVLGQLPHLLQWDERWGYQSYGDSTIAASGCGPTCVSMVVVGLTGDTTVTPYRIAQYAENNGYVLEGGGSYTALAKDAPAQWGLEVKETVEDEAFVANETAKGNPVICSLGPGEFFTTVGHFIVITGYDDGMLTILDPFSIENTNKKWKYSDIKSQILGLYSCMASY